MRGLIFVGIVAMVATWWGGQNSYVALRDRQQLEISCADYVKSRPDARWLKLTGCEYDFEHLAYEQTKAGKISAVYLPLRPAGEEGGPTRIVVKRDDDEMLKVAQALENDDAKPQPAFDHVTAQLAQPAEGLVQFGLDLDDKDKEELGKLGLGLANDFVLVDNGAKPKLLAGLLVLCLGLGAAGFLLVLILRRFRAPKVPRVPPTPPPANNPLAPFERSI